MKTLIDSVRPGSDAELFMSRTSFVPQPSLIQLVKLLAKYVILIYALGWAHEKFGV